MDIYADLDDFDFSKRLKELQHENNLIQAKMLLIAKEYKNLQSANEELTKKNEQLEINISTLFKTANMEISRKDRIISELRTELDNGTIKKKTFIRQNVRVKTELIDSETVPTTENNENQSNTQVNTINSNSKQIESIDKEIKYSESSQFKKEHNFNSSRSNCNEKSNTNHRTHPNVHKNDDSEKRYQRKSPQRFVSTYRARSPVQRHEERKRRSRSRSKDSWDFKKARTRDDAKLARNNRHHVHRDRSRERRY